MWPMMGSMAERRTAARLAVSSCSTPERCQAIPMTDTRSVTSDEKPRTEGEQGSDAQAPDGDDIVEGEAAPDGEGEEGDAPEEDADRPLSDLLIRDLTAHRTLGLRLNLSEQPEAEIVAVTHALAAQIFCFGANAHVVGIQLVKTDLAAHADGIEDTPAGKVWTDRHANWARQIPRDVATLWSFVAELDHDSRRVLLAHCVALTVNAVKSAWDRRPRAKAAADQLAEAVSLDMTGYWRPTVRGYLGRITKARILEAVSEGVGSEAAELIAGMKKAEMAQAVEQLLAPTDWLPSLLRTAKPHGSGETPCEMTSDPACSQAAQ
jgi:ParB family transcriptional regulator, chromosome partitioning protein